MNQQLPPGWHEANIDDLFTIVRGVSYKGAEAIDHAREGYVPIVRANNIQDSQLVFDDLVWVPAKYVGEHQYLQAGDIVMATSSGSIKVVGKTAKFNGFEGAIAFGAFCSVIRKNEGGNPAWLSKFFQTVAYRSYVEEKALGIHINNLRTQHLSSLTLPLAPIPEQKRIVAKLDALMARSRTAREELDHIPKLIERYKQAVLYKAFEEIIMSGVPLIELGELAASIRNGLSRKPAESAPGIPILRISSVRPGKVFCEDMRYYQPISGEDLSNFYLRDGDLLFVRYNGNPNLVAVCGLFKSAETDFVYPDKLIRVRLKDYILPKYVEHYFQTRQVRQELSPYIKTAAGQHGISGTDLKRTLIPVPSLDVQREAVQRINSAFLTIESVLLEVEKAGQLTKRQETAILSKAFQGALVPQDPNDEPASVLLERIRAERTAQSNNGKAKRKR